MIKEKICEFLERDENSSVAPGSRDTITKNKITKQKRFLCDTLDNLYKKYLKYEPLTISKSIFYRYKPFWIVKKELTARDTCLCKVHANFNFRV